MKLEKFDLEKALNGAKVVTRDGREVTQLTKFETSDIMTIYGVVDGEVYGWDKNGTYGYPSLFDNDNELFLAVEPESIWVNVYCHKGKLQIVGTPHNSLTQAKANILHSVNRQYIKTIEITDEP
jgi:hypothetical protein